MGLFGSRPASIIADKFLLAYLKITWNKIDGEVDLLRKGGAIMKGKIVTLVLLFLASLLFPYTMTILCFDTGLMSYQPEEFV